MKTHDLLRRITSVTSATLISSLDKPVEDQRHYSIRFDPSSQTVIASINTRKKPERLQLSWLLMIYDELGAIPRNKCIKKKIAGRNQSPIRAVLVAAGLFDYKNGFKRVS